jgi:hypothetical protein
VLMSVPAVDHVKISKVEKILPCIMYTAIYDES